MFDFWRKKANPFVSKKEAFVLDMADQLRNWPTAADRHEIITAVVDRVLPGLHLHKNPIPRTSVAKAAAMRKFDDMIQNLKEVV